MTTDFQERARRLRNAVEPVAAGVYFAPEAHAAYEELGFAGSPVTHEGAARPEMTAYFTSRGVACMGDVPGEVVAAAFGCFNPKAVVPAVEKGRQIADRETILAAREKGATAMLARVLGDQPDGLARVTELLRRGADAARWKRTRSMGACARSVSPALRSVTCGELRTCCGSTAATATSSPGQSAASMRSRSCC
jgi:hypothetical protein